MNRQRRNSKSRSPRNAKGNDAVRVLGEEDATLLDLVDNALSRGVVLTGDLTIALANVDLVYARLSLLLCAADRILPGESYDLLERRHSRKARMRRLARRD
jgi:gas vesicle structural protein